MIELFNAGRYAELESYARLLLNTSPRSGFVWKALASSLYLQGKESLSAAQKAAEFLLDDPAAWSDLGVIQLALDMLDEAAESFCRALRIAPHFAQAHNNLGSVYKERAHFETAEASYRKAIKINPQYAEAHSNLAYALLAMGRYAEGWREYEYRWEGLVSHLKRPVTPLPQWYGEKILAHDKLLIFEEQGFGDKIQFCRYLPLVLERFSGNVAFVLGSPLRELVRRSFPAVEILGEVPADQSCWQWQCPLLSLPLAFNTTVETIPADIPYLVPDPEKVSYWKEKIAGLSLPKSTRKIGVVWKSASRITASRFLPPEILAPLLDLPRCTWFSLQKDAGPSPIPTSGKLIDWSEEFRDFDQTAALIVNLDIVVAIDTSVAHLAAALGRPTWLLNRKASEWRWMSGREDSPWYPTMRVFSQETAGDWHPVAQRISVELSH